MPVYDIESRLASAIQNVSQCDTHPNNKEAIATFKIEAEADGLKPITVERYINVLTTICSHVDFDLTTASQLQLKQLVADINNNRLHDADVSPWTRKKYKSALSKFIALLDISVDLSFMSINVSRSEQKELTPHLYPNRERVKAMMQACNNVRDKALIAVLWDTGARISPVLELQWDRVGFDERNVTVLRSKTGSRTVPIRESVDALRRWYEQCV